jgi:hypothetical protein
MKRLLKYAVGVALIAVVALAVALPVAGAKTTKSLKSGKCFPTMSGKAWSFGVMADTQWTGIADDGKNPNTVAVEVIKQLNQQFISKGVKFVIQVGDLTDNGSNLALDTTAAFRQSLYSAGIGFYPLRGNHESSQTGANEFLRVFPQTQNALMNTTPGDAYTVTNPDALTQPFPTKSGPSFKVGSISASPAAPAGFGGLCYAFDYNNARFVMLDQFVSSDGASHTTSATQVLDNNQVAWMNAQLAGRSAGTQAFVFGHKGIITENHVDTLFGANPTANQTPPAQGIQNAFISDLQANGVRYYLGGHDHMHNRAIVKSPNGSASVENIIAQSDSSKFYVPAGAPGNGTLPLPDYKQTNDYKYDVPAFGTTRETEIAQEAVAVPASGTTNTVHVGYYIFTVCGPSVTVDYYSAPITATNSGGEFLAATPTLAFTKVESFGYSLNGKEFVVGGGSTNGTNNSPSYTAVQDSFDGTSAKIIAGTYANTATDVSGRTLAQTVDTGWTCDTPWDDLSSNILTLWGMAPLGTTTTAQYALSMSYDAGPGHHYGFGGLGVLATKDASGHWVKAVDLNSGGGVKRFVIGPYQPQDTLGTYGVDPSTHTAWAVINCNGSFAVDRGLDLVWNN